LVSLLSNISVMRTTIVYNPLLSIEDNAKQNNVSTSTIRKYIKDNGIDRRFDEQKAKFMKVKELQKSNPSITIAEIQKQLGYSFYTVKKYMTIDETNWNPRNGKFSSFDLSKADNLVKSVSDSQDEILKGILKLYIPKGRFDCDLTFSKGVFYKNIPIPHYIYDKYPLSNEVQSLDEAYKLEDGRFDSIVLDLPFLVKDIKGAATSMVSQRFNSFRTVDELYQTNETMMKLAFRLLSSKGLLIMKTMDVNANGKQYWIGNNVQNIAYEIGFELVDTFILLSRTKILSTKGTQQHCARKWHSYFFVFRKK